LKFYVSFAEFSAAIVYAAVSDIHAGVVFLQFFEKIQVSYTILTYTQPFKVNKVQ